MWLLRQGFFWLALIIMVVFLYSLAAFSHGWYDGDCCSDKDCRLAHPGEVTVRDDEVHVWLGGTLTRLSLRDQKVRPTRDPDNRPALCVVPGGLRCVYIPNGGV